MPSITNTIPLPHPAELAARLPEHARVTGRYGSAPGFIIEAMSRVSSPVTVAYLHAVRDVASGSESPRNTLDVAMRNELRQGRVCKVGWGLYVLAKGAR